MHRLSPNYYFALVLLIVVLLSQSEAKRGCALYGHSCYGGHGKRSEISMDAAPVPNADKTFSNINKEVAYPINNELNGYNPMDTGNDNHWKSKNEINYAVYSLLRRWIEDARAKAADDSQQAPETDTIFKNTFV